eukprot:84985-Pelagomonas_calceolata.AAC.6
MAFTRGDQEVQVLDICIFETGFGVIKRGKCKLLVHRALPEPHPDAHSMPNHTFARNQPLILRRLISFRQTMLPARGIERGACSKPGCLFSSCPASCKQSSVKSKKEEHQKAKREHDVPVFDCIRCCRQATTTKAVGCEPTPQVHNTPSTPSSRKSHRPDKCFFCLIVPSFWNSVLVVKLHDSQWPLVPNAVQGLHTDGASGLLRLPRQKGQFTSPCLRTAPACLPEDCLPACLPEACLRTAPA